VAACWPSTSPTADAHGIAFGVPTGSATTLRLPIHEKGRPVAALFNDERIVVRAWPARENRITIAELTF
jgi:hypothetical protein